MKKTWKKIISVLLVIAMVTGGIFLPERNVYADTGGDTTGGVGGGSSTKKSEANTCTYGYRIYIAPNTITDEKKMIQYRRHTLNYRHMQNMRSIL